MEWQPIETAPENVEVETIISDKDGPRNQQSLVRKGRLWWFTDGSMYVYYTPTHWRQKTHPRQPLAVTQPSRSPG